MPTPPHPTLGRAESTTASNPNNATPTPSLSNKTLPSTAPNSLSLTTTNSNSNNNTTQKAGKQAPKVDIEPIYAELKRSVGEQFWGVYKDAVAGFVLGLLSQKELARLTDHVILLDPLRESLHNQLICAIYTNASREVAEPGVASWVSSNEKHGANGGIAGAGMKHVGGDAAEQRLRAEVMQLPPRVRGRLKGIADDPPTPLLHSLHLTRTQSRLNPPSAPPSLLPSLSQPSLPTPTPSTNLNQSVEIRRRYNLPLATESHDLPLLSTLADRITPICYEEGLPSGPQEAETCLELLNTGLEAFLKDVLVSVLGRSVVNAPVSGPPPMAVVMPVPVADPITTTSTSSMDSQPAALAPTLISSSQQPALVPIPPLPAPTSAQPVSLTGAAVGITSGPRMGILTAGYKRKLSLEESAVARGDLKRTDLGLLPCEVAALRRQRELERGMMGSDVGGGLGGDGKGGTGEEEEKLVGVPSDLRLAWELGDHWLRDVVPWMGEKFVGMMGEESFFYNASSNTNANIATSLDVGKLKTADLAVTNGMGSGQIDADADVDGDADADGEADDVDGDVNMETDWKWQGAGAADRMALGALLDECLAVGQ